MGSNYDSSKAFKYYNHRFTETDFKVKDYEIRYKGIYSYKVVIDKEKVLRDYYEQCINSCGNIESLQSYLEHSDFWKSESELEEVLNGKFDSK